MRHYENELFHQRLKEVATAFGTPLYVYDSQKIRQCYRHLKKSGEGKIDIFFSLKANPNVTVSTLLNDLGAGAEVCSGIELKIALLSGFLPENIIFVGPAKKTEEIIFALEQNIYAIVCESKEEVSWINALAKTRSVVANIAIRVNPAFTVRDASLKMGGVPSQFGIDQEELFQNKTYFVDQSHVNIKGIHVYNGTRILQAETFVENTKRIFELSDELAKQWEVTFSLVDIGGGIGVPYFKNEIAFDIDKLNENLKPILRTYKKEHPDQRIILESGRYLVADSGVFISRIEQIKKSRDIFFLITDGGMHCHLTAAGYGSPLKRNFPIRLLTNNKTQITNKYHITGPLCTPADTIGRAVELPEARVGDYIAIFASGAYGPTASPVLFLGHGHPREIMLKNDKAILIRERDFLDDFLRKQKQLVHSI